MDNITLRKVQLAQLEIAKEIKRVCDKIILSTFLIQEHCLGRSAIRDLSRGTMTWI